MRKLCGNYADMLQFPFPHDYAKIMRKLCEIMRIMQTSKNYADYADPTLLMAAIIMIEKLYNVASGF
jgi:hypothetical protein